VAMLGGVWEFIGLEVPNAGGGGYFASRICGV